jgi:BirA family biotin operon repressor/biotin-[acetyl-CoA-carboxylase] ligase
VHLDVTDSTNDRARELAGRGAPGGTLVVAEEQTAGRGRQGRQWVAPRGSALTASALVRAQPDDFVETLSLLPLACSVAVCEAVEEIVPIRCRIKWPNDVLVGERKVAGILIEARPQEHWAVAGIGLNVGATRADFPEDLRATATSLRIECGAPVDRNLVLGALLRRLSARVAPGPESGHGAVLSAYRERDALRGKRIVWTSRGERIGGVAQGIDEDGNLVVVDDGAERSTLDAGEVHLGS